MPLTTIKSENTHFAQKYDYQRALNYYDRYYKSPRKRFINWLEQKMLRRGLHLIGKPVQILDLPAGTGRFWQSLQYAPKVQLQVADFNLAMLQVGLEKRPSLLTNTLKTTVASAFNLPFADNSFDNITCMRFIHHINLKEDRLQLLTELARVSADTICLSAWVEATGIKAASRFKKQALRDPQKEYNKFVLQHEQLLQEFTLAGLELIGHTDLLPNFSPWRLYILKKKQRATLNPASYVCPICKGPLVTENEQFVCKHDKLAFPMQGQIPMLTQRDSIKLT